MPAMPAPSPIITTPAAFPERRRFTVREYEQMIKAGVFGEDDRLELIEGELIPLSPIGPDHAGHVNRLNRLFTRRVGGHALVSIQNPLQMARSEPQPDLMLLRSRADDYTRSHPKPNDVLLLVEVADTSVEFDQTIKLRLYAQAKIPEVWIVNLLDKWVEVYRGPGARGYKEKRTVSLKESLTPLALPNVTLKVREILSA